MMEKVLISLAEDKTLQKPAYRSAAHMVITVWTLHATSILPM
jgi:hypothetical protein